MRSACRWTAAAPARVRQRLTSFLARRQMLLLVRTTASTSWTRRPASSTTSSGCCPDVTVLATSREALALPDEVQVTVGSACHPAGGHHRPAVCWSTRPRSCSPSGRAPCDPAWSSTATNLSAVGHICRRAGRHPAGAGTCRRQGRADVARRDRGQARPALLVPDIRYPYRRSAAADAAGDGGVELCTARARSSDGCSTGCRSSGAAGSLTAAEAVVADDRLSAGVVLDTVGRLVERSMVRVERGCTDPLPHAGDLAGVRRRAAAPPQVSAEAIAGRHASHFRAVAERAEVELRGHGQRETLRLLREEQPNIRAAITWLSRPGGDIDSALVTAGSLGMFWHLGRHLEGREVLGRLVESGEGSTPARARALQAVSIVERPRGCLVHPHPRCAETAEESLSIFNSLDDPWHAALSKVLVAVEGVTGAYPERSDALLREAERGVFTRGRRLGSRGHRVRAPGDRDEGR